MTFLSRKTTAPEGTTRYSRATGATAWHAARRALSLRPRRLSLEQDSVPARCHARGRHHRAEQHHQDFFGRSSGADAADLDRLDLRHEFPPHARARLEMGLSDRDRSDGGRGRAALFLLQVEEVAVSGLTERT